MMSENILLCWFICISLNISEGDYFPQWYCHLSTFMASLCISGINQRFLSGVVVICYITSLYILSYSE